MTVVVERRRQTRRRADIDAWLGRHAPEMAALVAVLFAVLAVLAVGVAAAADTARDALRVQRSAEQREILTRREIDDLVAQNRRMLAQIEALRRQVESLGAVPVNVIIEDRRPPATPQPSNSGTSQTMTTEPPASTTTTEPCPLPFDLGRCAVPRDRRR